MPIVGEKENVHVEYDIPENIRALLTHDFLKEFRNQLFRIFEFSLESFADQGIPMDTSTSGWFAAFGKTCLLHNKTELLDYWDSLPWYDSDIFDGLVADMMVKEKLILDDSKIVIADQLNMDQEEIEMCDTCYRYFPVDFLHISDKSETKEPEYICPHCLDVKNSPNENATEYYKGVLKELEERKKQRTN